PFSIPPISLGSARAEFRQRALGLPVTEAVPLTIIRCPMIDTQELSLPPADRGVRDTGIRGALGTLSSNDVGPRTSWAHRLRTLLAVLGPGLIVMVGDNDAGAFSTYAQAGQNYGTSLLWTLALLIPVLYVNQEMVIRLGAIAQVGHAKLILRRFGRFWGA